MFFFSPSDLDADDEDNQNQSDSTVSSLVQVIDPPTRPRPGTPTGEAPEEVIFNETQEFILLPQIFKFLLFCHIG